ncbi:MAG: histidinol-phosphatase [Bifidobacteriaceae bacterium]|jgi:histidinol-phosphatase|nr:histidinol-phosphatase [Bifidobacteriaceae bacterium]
MSPNTGLPTITPDAPYRADILLAHELANWADEITTDRFWSPDLEVHTKADMTPVTDADQRVEQLLCNKLAKTRPSDAIVGEEFGAHGSANRTWVIDPIDGTKNFLRGVPVWATLIGLIEDGQPVLGMVSAPAIGRRWWAARGFGAYIGRSFTTGQPIHVSDISELADASFSCSSLGGWDKADRLDQYVALSRAVWRTRGYGDFWSYMMVAEGSVDIAAEPELAFHDMAAVAAIVIEAGGRFTDTSGQVDGPFGKDALATNGILHDQALGFLAPRK